MSGGAELAEISALVIKSDMIDLQLDEAAAAVDGHSTRADVRVHGCGTDTRSLQAGCLYVALRGEHFDGHEFAAEAVAKGAAALMVERTLALDVPQIVVDDTRRALGRLAAAWRARFTLPLVAVTGSNGKTTLKEMLRSIFQQSGYVLATHGNLNNDIGVPLTLFELDPRHEFAVVEMGANHAGEIAQLTAWAGPEVAVITQCAPAHLAGFESIEGVARAKGEIFSGLSARGIAVINQDDTYAKFWRSLVPGRTVFGFGLDHPADFSAYAVSVDARASLAQTFGMHTPLGEVHITLPVPGRHNVRNALAATACAVAAGCDLEQVAAGLAEFQPAPGRLQIRAGMRGCRLVDDTYNANPGSFHAALKVLAGLPAPRWLVMGDMRELGEAASAFHHEIGAAARDAGIEHLYAIGEYSRAAVEGFGAQGRHFTSHAELVAALHEALPADAGVLVKGSRGMRMEQVVQALL